MNLHDKEEIERIYTQVKYAANDISVLADKLQDGNLANVHIALRQICRVLMNHNGDLVKVPAIVNSTVSKPEVSPVQTLNSGTDS